MVWHAFDGSKIIQSASKCRSSGEKSGVRRIEIIRPRRLRLLHASMNEDVDIHDINLQWEVDLPGETILAP